MSAAIRTSLRGPDLGRQLAANRAARRPWKLGAIPPPHTPRPVEAGARIPGGAKASRAAGPLVEVRGAALHSAECKPPVAPTGAPAPAVAARGTLRRDPTADRALLHLMIQKQRYNPVVSNALKCANSALPHEARLDAASADIVRRLRKHPELARKARAIAGCSRTWLVAVPLQSGAAGKSRPVPTDQCRERLCPRCQRVRARKWAERVRPLLEHLDEGEGRPAKFLTLTQVSRPGESLRASLRRFNAHFRALYLHPEWKSRVRGYVAAREVTWTKKKCWHFHVHVLADFEYWPQKDISALWHSITGDSYIVDVRAVKRGSEREAIKYPIKFIGVPPSKVVELVESTAGVRMISIGGEWRKHLRVADMEPQDCPEGHELVPAAVLYERAAAGCVRSTQALAAVLDWALARGEHVHRVVLLALMRPRDALHDPAQFDLLREYQSLGLEAIA